MSKSKSQQLSIFTMMNKSTSLSITQMQTNDKEMDSTNDKKKRKLTDSIKGSKAKQTKLTVLASGGPPVKKPRGPYKPRQTKQSNKMEIDTVDSDSSNSHPTNPTVKAKAKPKPKAKSETVTKTKTRQKKTLDSDNEPKLEPGTFNVPLDFQPNALSSDSFFHLSATATAAVPQASAATIRQELTEFQGHREQITRLKNATLWTYKYAPRSLAELVGQGQAQVDLDRWIGERKTNPYYGYQCCTVVGSSGSGTTTLARLALQRHGYKVVSINPTMLRQNSNYGCSTTTTSEANGAPAVDSQSAMLDLVYNYASKLKNMQGESIALLLEQVDGELWSHCFPFATFEKLLVLHNPTLWEQRQVDKQVYLKEQKQLQYLQSINAAEAGDAAEMNKITASFTTLASKYQKTYKLPARYTQPLICPIICTLRNSSTSSAHSSAASKKHQGLISKKLTKHIVLQMPYAKNDLSDFIDRICLEEQVKLPVDAKALLLSTYSSDIRKLLVQFQYLTLLYASSGNSNSNNNLNTSSGIELLKNVFVSQQGKSNATVNLLQKLPKLFESREYFTMMNNIHQQLSVWSAQNLYHPQLALRMCELIDRLDSTLQANALVMYAARIGKLAVAAGGGCGRSSYGFNETNPRLQQLTVNEAEELVAICDGFSLSDAYLGERETVGTVSVEYSELAAFSTTVISCTLKTPTSNLSNSSSRHGTASAATTRPSWQFANFSSNKSAVPQLETLQLTPINVLLFHSNLRQSALLAFSRHKICVERKRTNVDELCSEYIYDFGISEQPKFLSDEGKLYSSGKPTAPTQSFPIWKQLAAWKTLSELKATPV